MSSITDTELPTRNLSLREAEPGSRRNFNLRAYLAGGAATTALIAGAIVVFASLGAYVAFNGLPIGSGDENASQLTIGAPGSGAPEAAAAVLGAASGAVAATSANPAATGPGAQSAGGPAGGGSGPTTPGGAPIVPITGATGTVPSGVPGGGGAGAGPVDQLGGTANLPVGEASDPVTGPAADALGGALGGISEILVPPQGGQQLGNGIDGATGGAAGKLLDGGVAGLLGK